VPSVNMVRGDYARSAMAFILSRISVPPCSRWTSLVELALELGYVDQPHFVRDFKAVVGVTPGSYARALGKLV